MVLKAFFERAMLRKYQWQLHANRVSLLSVVLCGGAFKDYLQLRDLYKAIGSGKKTELWTQPERDAFWARYWHVDRCYQPWLVAHVHRAQGLQEDNPFFQNPVNERTWLYSDVIDYGIPCGMLWSWIESAAFTRLEAACLLSGFSHDTLYGELAWRIKTNPLCNQDFLFASMAMAMVFRMSIESLADDFSKEADAWKNMYARWDIKPRMLILNVLGTVDKERSRHYMYEWGPELFPEARAMLDVARATDQHPAHVVRQWYEQRDKPPAPMLDITGLI